MYRYLDRSLGEISTDDQVLVCAMRAWVIAARSGRCVCSAFAPAFRRHGVEAAMNDFALVMATLDSAAIGRLRFGSLDLARLTDDEARILALFDAARAGPLDRLRRVSASLVSEDATARLAQAADFVVLAMADMDTGRHA